MQHTQTYDTVILMHTGNGMGTKIESFPHVDQLITTYAYSLSGYALHNIIIANTNLQTDYHALLKIKEFAETRIADMVANKLVGAPK